MHDVGLPLDGYRRLLLRCDERGSHNLGMLQAQLGRAGATYTDGTEAYVAMTSLNEP